MKENFENVKNQIKIEEIATYLLGEPVKGMYRYPSEKTPSIKIYPQTQSFYDFGRGGGGDAVKLWSHVRNIDNWTALQEIAALYGLSTDLNEADRRNIAKRIKREERAQRVRRKAEKRARRLWASQVERLKMQEEFYDNLLKSPHIKPLSDLWCWLVSAKQMVSYRLDCLCGIE